MAIIKRRRLDPAGWVRQRSGGRWLPWHAVVAGSTHSACGVVADVDMRGRAAGLGRRRSVPPPTQKVCKACADEIGLRRRNVTAAAVVGKKLGDQLTALARRAADELALGADAGATLARAARAALTVMTCRMTDGGTDDGGTDGRGAECVRASPPSCGACLARWALEDAVAAFAVRTRILEPETGPRPLIEGTELWHVYQLRRAVVRSEVRRLAAQLGRMPYAVEVARSLAFRGASDLCAWVGWARSPRRAEELSTLWPGSLRPTMPNDPDATPTWQPTATLAELRARRESLLHEQRRQLSDLAPDAAPDV